MNHDAWGILAKPPATLHWWRIRLRARRYARLREDYDVDRWLAAMWANTS
jgi:hypothetical protein